MILQYSHWTTVHQHAAVSPFLILWQMVDITAKNCGMPEALPIAINWMLAILNGNVFD